MNIEIYFLMLDAWLYTTGLTLYTICSSCFSK